ERPPTESPYIWPRKFSTPDPNEPPTTQPALKNWIVTVPSSARAGDAAAASMAASARMMMRKRVIGVPQVVPLFPSWPGLSRPSRLVRHRAHLIGMPGSSPGMTKERGQARPRRRRELSVMPILRTPRGAPARVALHAGAVAHQREVAAFAAGFALVALGAGLGALFGRGLLGVRLGVGPVERIELGC